MSVRDTIESLKTLGCRNLSDRYPILPRDDRAHAVKSAHNIFDNQSCILPVDPEQERSSHDGMVDSVVVYYSPLLEAYLSTPFAAQYLARIRERYTAAMRLPRRTRKDVLEALKPVVHEYSKYREFHHVITEIAFIHLRIDILGADHGIIPVALGCSMSACRHLSQLATTDLWIVWPDAPQDADKVFFKLLKRMYPSEISYISGLQRQFEKYRVRGLTSQAKFNMAQQRVQLQMSKMGDTIEPETRGKPVRSTPTQAQRAQGDLLQRKRAFLAKVGQDSLPPVQIKDRNGRRLKGTCEWFKSHHHFRDWVASNNSRVLLVTADPGCGKSVLARHLIDDVLSKKAFVSYFFFKDDFDAQRSLAGALRSILHQILSSYNHLITEALLSELDDGTLKLDSPDMIWEVLLKLPSPQYSTDLICVLDALDECAEAGREDLIQKLIEFQRSRIANPRLKFLVTSRPYNFVSRPFRALERTYPTIHISGDGAVQAEQISKEVDLVISERVRQMVDLSSKEQQFLQHEIRKLPNRTYLWSHLMLNEIDYMSKFDRESLRKRLQNLPRTAEDAYENVLRRIRPDDREDAVSILHFIVAAERPLAVSEMAVALELRAEHYGASRGVEVDASARFKTFLRVVSGFFVKIIDDKVHLLHQTAREFLLSGTTAASPGRLQAGWKSSISLDAAQARVGLACVVRLSMTDCPLAELLHRSGLYQGGEEKALRARPFLSYAKDYLKAHMWHVDETDEYSQVIERAAHLAAYTRPQDGNWFSYFEYDSQEITQHQPLLVTQDWSLDLVTRIMQQIPPESRDAKDHEGNSPLHIAVNNEDEDRVVTLAEGGLNLDLQDYHGCTALMVQVEKGPPETSMIELLVSLGASVDTFDGTDGQTPLMVACEDDNPFAFEALMEGNPNLNAANDRGYTALLTAAQNCVSSLACMIIDKGVSGGVLNLDHANQNGDTALHLAAKYHAGGVTEPFSDDAPEIIEALLANGANVMARNNNGETPLHLAATYKYRAFARIEPLIRHGADLSARDNSRRTPLERARAAGAREAFWVLSKYHSGHRPWPKNPTPQSISRMSASSHLSPSLAVQDPGQQNLPPHLAEIKWAHPQGRR